MTETLGDRIRQARKRKKIKQQDLARQIGFTGAALCMMEKDKRAVSSETLRRIAEICGVSADELLFGKRG